MAVIDFGVTTDNRLHAQTAPYRYDATATAGLDRLCLRLTGATDCQIGSLGEKTVVLS
jgi:hypothetical protein